VDNFSNGISHHRYERLSEDPIAMARASQTAGGTREHGQAVPGFAPEQAVTGAVLTGRAPFSSIGDSFRSRVLPTGHQAVAAAPRRARSSAASIDGDLAQDKNPLG
jgi:hypothetical protein